VTFYEKVGQKKGSTFFKSRVKVGILLLKSGDSRAIFLHFYQQITHFEGGGRGKNRNFISIYQGLDIFKRKFEMY